MGDANGRLCFVHMLSPCAGRSERIDLQIVRIDAHLHILRLRAAPLRSDCAGLNTALGLCFRHSLHPVNAAFKFQAEYAPSPSMRNWASLRRPAPFRCSSPPPPESLLLQHTWCTSAARMRKQCCLLTSMHRRISITTLRTSLGSLGSSKSFIFSHNCSYSERAAAISSRSARLKNPVLRKLLRRLQIPLTLLQSSPDFDQRRKFFPPPGFKASAAFPVGIYCRICKSALNIP